MTDILTLIDEAVADWEARPESWLPGDPLYLNPDDACGESADCVRLYEACVAAGCIDQDSCEHDCEHQHVRPMIELHDLDTTEIELPRSHCRPCGVRWTGHGPCWNCGHYAISRPAVVLDERQMEALAREIAHGVDRRPVLRFRSTQQLVIRR